MEESRKEFWGLTPASLLASCGLLVMLILLNFDLGFVRNNLIGIAALMLIGAAVLINRRKGLNEKWRRVNYVLHIVMFLLVLGIMVFCNCR